MVLAAKRRVRVEEILGYQKGGARLPNWKYPDFLEIQKNSFRDFWKKAVMGREDVSDDDVPRIKWGWFERLLKRFSPIEYGKWRLEFLDFEFVPIKVRIHGKEVELSPEECRYQGRDYARAIRIKTRITNLETGESREDWVNMGTMPWMTDRATFIVNGVERVIVNQIIRSPGIYLQEGDREWTANLIPETGTWIDVILQERKQTQKSKEARYKFTVTLDRRHRNIPITAFMRAFGYVSDVAIKDRLMKSIEPKIEEIKRDATLRDKYDIEGIRREITQIIESNAERDHISELWRMPSIYDRLVKVLVGGEVLEDVGSSHFVLEKGTLITSEVLRKFIEHVLPEQMKTGAFDLKVRLNAEKLRMLRGYDLVDWVVLKPVKIAPVYLWNTKEGIVRDESTGEEWHLPEGCALVWIYSGAQEGLALLCDQELLTLDGQTIYSVSEGEEILKDGIVDESGAYKVKFKILKPEGAKSDEIYILAYVRGSHGPVLAIKKKRKKKVEYVPLSNSKEKITEKDLYWPAGEIREEDALEFERYVLRSPQVTHIDVRVPWDKIVQDAAYLAIYSMLSITSTAELTNPKEARERVRRMLFDPHRNYLGEVALYRIARRFGHEVSDNLTEEDLVEMFALPLKLFAKLEKPDDIDHLGNRRVRAVGELVYTSLINGFRQLVNRVVRDNMLSYTDDAIPKPSRFLSYRPIQRSLKQFFQGQLAQLLDDTNPLAALTHKRRVTALGPGGLTRERAGVEVRDVHPSHYGRLCPIETPEGQNIGLINSLAVYAKLNEYGFIIEPYRRVKDGIVLDGDENIVWLDAIEEEDEYIAPADIAVEKVDGGWKIRDEEVVVRHKGRWEKVPREMVTLVDAGANQIFSVSTSLIPFVDHDDSNRALMGSNMERQAVCLIKPDAPRVGTGMEKKVAKDSGAALFFEPKDADGNLRDDVVGYVEYVDSREIRIRMIPESRINKLDLKKPGKLSKYPLYTGGPIELTVFRRNNKDTATHFRPVVHRGDILLPGDVIADSLNSKDGELGLGKNLLVAFVPWEGYNYEDAILISRRLVRDDELTSIFIDEYTVEARRISTGSKRARRGGSVIVEEITRDVPGLTDEEKRNLGEDGIVRIGAYVTPGSVLVGKITPQPEEEREVEMKLLAHIFGDKITRAKNTSLRMPPGESGVVIDVKVYEEDKGYELPADVVKVVKVYIAQKRKIKEGDKLAGRHGNKGVVAKILPEEDMPYLPDGTPVDVVLNPLGVPSRMNVGQVLETHLGWVGRILGVNIEVPTFQGPSAEEVSEAIEVAEKKLETEGRPIGMTRMGKVTLFDGRTGEPFQGAVMVGEMHIMKLIHMVDDKVHARSTGPYALITQQPLGGKTHFGGQRLGEMEVWALESYGAAHTLLEMLTIKSDDVEGRKKAYDAIVRGEPIQEIGEPESFKVLVKELNGLALAVEEIQYHKGRNRGETLRFETTTKRGDEE